MQKINLRYWWKEKSYDLLSLQASRYISLLSSYNNRDSYQELTSQLNIISSYTTDRGGLIEWPGPPTSLNLTHTIFIHRNELVCNHKCQPFAFWWSEIPLVKCDRWSLDCRVGLNEEVLFNLRPSFEMLLLLLPSSRCRLFDCCCWCWRISLHNWYKSVGFIRDGFKPGK